MNKEISYPNEGHEQCFEIEDNSFWFKSRNKVISFITQKYSLGHIFADVGGGNGYVSQYLKKFNNDIQINLVEPGSKGCENSKKRNIDNIYNTTIDKVDISMDSIGLFDVIEHIEEPIIFLEECSKKLNDNGKVYITVPAYQILWSHEDVHAGHFRRYTKNSIIKELEIAGFKVIYISHFFVFLLPFIFILRVIPYKLGKKDINDTSKDHKTGVTGFIIERILDLELLLMKIGINFPIGASILVCAQKEK